MKQRGSRLQYKKSSLSNRSGYFLNKAITVFIHPFFIALLLTGIIYLISPVRTAKYKTELLKKEYNYESKVYFKDLNHDSLSEMVVLFFDGNKDPHAKKYNSPALEVRTDYSVERGYRVFEQYNLEKPWYKFQDVSFGDVDSDDNLEIYFFCANDDSLFLCGIDPFNRNDIFMMRFLTTFQFDRGFPDINPLSELMFHDLDGDGYKEIIGAVNAGYAADPRFLFSYNFISDTLVKSSTAYAYLGISDIMMTKDSTIVMTTSSFAPGNVEPEQMTHDSLFSDFSSYLFLMDEEFNFLYGPVENPGSTSAISSFFLKGKEEDFIFITLRKTGGISPTTIVKQTLDGKILKEKTYHDSINYSLSRITDKKETSLYLKNGVNNMIFELDADLETKKTHTAEYNVLLFEDLDSDGENEILNWDNGFRELIIYRKGFKSPSKVEIDPITKFSLSLCNLKDNSADFIIHLGDYTYFFKYGPDPAYYAVIPVFIVVYLLFVFLMYAILYFHKKTIEKKYETEKKMTELELLTIKNQIDPHFTFNALNSISAVLFSEERKTAYKYLVNFSSLIRSALHSSKDISVPLESELDFIKQYLELEKFRFENKFNFEIKVDGKVDLSVQIPKMILHTFVENAIKHGIMHREDGGMVKVTIQQEDERLIIGIEDNGIGRKEAAKQKMGNTGKGFEIINQIIEMYNKLHHKKVTYTVDDIYGKDEDVNGTLVTVIIANE